MKIAASSMIAFVALEHLGFLVLEMFLWTEPLGMQVFGLSRAFAVESAGLAANQGLYNGFLAAGLIWSLMPGRSDQDAFERKIFFLSCVVIAGLFGAATASRSILFVQAMPAAIAIMLVWRSNAAVASSDAS